MHSSSFAYRAVRMLIPELFLIIAVADVVHAQGPIAEGNARDGIKKTSQVVGKWSYRSFVSNPDLNAEPNSLLFGSGTLDLAVRDPDELIGTLGGEGWQLDLSGKVTSGEPTKIRFTGKGIIGGEEWVYDYLGFAVPAWPNGIDQRPAIVGTIVRTKSHSGGSASAGYVAQWIAVHQDTKEGAETEGNVPTSNQSGGSYRSRLLNEFYEESKQQIESNSPQPSAGIPDRFGGDQANQTEADHTPADGQHVEHELVVDYRTHRIGEDDVRLRSYNNKLVGPTIRAKAGETIHITLRNRLPLDPVTSHETNSHHQWNTTNLHFHGLHVSPGGTPGAQSDNVMTHLEPLPANDPDYPPTERYAVKIPENHVAGTFWYHAHKHGAVAAQVSSGMAGALIVERDDDQHNLDSVPEIRASKENVLLLQQIPYLKPIGSEVGFIELSPDGSGQNELNMFGPRSWGALRRYVTVNGVRIPTIRIEPNEVRRLRFIHAGQRQEMVLTLVRASGDSGQGDPSIAFHEIAVDGLPLGEIRTKDTLSLYPGYRSDVLIQASAGTSGEFHLMDLRAPAGTGADGSPEPLQLVARVIVEGSPSDMSLPNLADLAKHRLPPPDSTALSGTQYAFYGIVPENEDARFYISHDNLVPGQVPTGFEFSLSTYRSLTLGDTERWIVGTRNAGNIAAVHPFHIHTNPFFVEEVRDPGDRIVTDEEIGGPTWRDTIAMKQGFTYRLLTRYEDFDGEFVNHCHVLDHEDNGMMELVRITGNSRDRSDSVGNSSPANVLETLPPPDGSPAVLFFVQGSFCPHCMEQVTAMIGTLPRSRCSVYVVSASTTEDLKQFPKTPFSLLADPTGKLFKQYELGSHTHGTFVLDGKGKVRLRETGEEPFMDEAAILRAIDTASQKTISHR